MERRELESKVKTRLMNRLMSDLNQVAMNRAIEAEEKANNMVQGMAQYQAYASAELDRLHEVDKRLTDTEAKLKALQSDDEELSETFDAYAERMSMKIVELKHEIRGLKANGGNAEVGNRIADMEAMLKEYQNQMTKLQYKQQILEDRLALNRKELEDYGFYMDVVNLFYNEGDTDKYRMELEANVLEQERMVDNGTACTCSTSWTVGNSRIQGERMTKNNIKLVLRAFNVEADNYISKIGVRSKLDNVIKHIESSFNVMNRLQKVNRIEISEQYLALKKQQAELVFQEMLARKAKKEEELRQKEILKEQKKVEEEIAKEKEKALKEEQMYLKELARIAKQDKLTEAMKARIAELEEYINKLNKDIEEMDERVNFKCRAGWCYVISNPSMPNIIKIGTTRRPDCQTRVDELSNASVPFRFNVHAKVFCEDAFAMEAQLHNHFNAKRVNKANNRKEYFEVSVEEVASYVLNEIDSTVEFDYAPYNEEWEQTQRINKSL